MSFMTLEQARGLLGWSQTKLAQEVGVQPTVISATERRKSVPSHRLVLEIVGALKRGGLSGLSVEDIAFVSTDASTDRNDSTAA